MSFSALDVFRYAVFAVFVCSAAVALGSWAVRTRRINPFGRLGQTIRKLSDPVLEPIEHRLLRRGGNPQQAPWWLLGVTVVGGIVLVSLVQWLAAEIAVMARTSTSGPRAVLRLGVYYISQLLLLAIIVRVIGSWFGVGRFNRWMKPVYGITDWVVEPLRRVIPPIGMIDITPIVAWFLIMVIRGWLLALL
ncbi:MAG: YggT family protein [Gemmatimonadales bacterium]|jgi:YggT family protein